MFSNIAYMGSDDNGMPIPAQKNSKGTYHLPGFLEVAPEAVLHKRVALMRPVLEAAGSAVIICALPRYVSGTCCTDKKHIQNRHEEDFLNGGTSCSTVLKTEGAKFGLTLDAFNLLSCFGQADSLAEIRSSGGLSLWRDDDPVHLTVAAYGDIAEVLTTQAAATNQQPPVEEAGQRGAHAENQKDPCQRA